MQELIDNVRKSLASLILALDALETGWLDQLPPDPADGCPSQAECDDIPFEHGVHVGAIDEVARAMKASHERMGWRLEAALQQPLFGTGWEFKNGHHVTISTTPRQNYGRVKAGERTREEHFYLPILQILQGEFDEFGGQVPTHRIYHKLERVWKDRFTHADRAEMPTKHHEPRWKDTVRWSLDRLKKQGHVTRPARSRWQITHSGRQYLAQVMSILAQVPEAKIR